MARKIVVYRSWWRFWRRPWFGINPIAWLTLDELPALRREVWVDGYEIPGDGGEGRFQWCSRDQA